jgi:hypothetical protein
MSRRDDFRDIAKSVPFDNTTPGATGMTSTDTQAAIEEIKAQISSSTSPGFSFGRSGNIANGTYLQCETVPSNISGRWIYINSATVKNVYVSNESLVTWVIEILYHDGNEVGLTSLGSVTITAAKGGAFPVNWPVPTGKQLAVRVTSGGPKNVICGLELRGTS